MPHKDPEERRAYGRMHDRKPHRLAKWRAWYALNRDRHNANSYASKIKRRLNNDKSISKGT
jgi:hypothetical protein